HHCWQGMEYTEDKKKLSEWVPLVMEGRAADEQVAATRIITGADVDYGSLTRSLVRYLAGMPGFAVHYSHRVTHISREPGGRWRIEMKNPHSGECMGASSVAGGSGEGAVDNGRLGHPIFGCVPATEYRCDRLPDHAVSGTALADRGRCPASHL